MGQTFTRNILRGQNYRICQYEKCENKVMIGRLACEAHTCPVSNCDEPMITHTSFCQFHQNKRRT